ncbi:putative transmembrane protein 132D [Triplophysa rosa]|uniref:Transmembrane protein 132D n=1 Tax=Triplophysa rosa TaxID=992332 RepID=A0A9W7TF79_TRIRA|nr:putative transmembrane protein 132D [Triplophysa rosa]
MSTMLLMVIALCLPYAEGMKVVELSEDPRAPLSVHPTVNYQIINAGHLLLRDISQDTIDNSSLTVQRQPFILTGLSGQPAINVSYGPMSLEQSILPHMIYTGPRIRPFILARQIRSSTPVIYLLFYATGNRGDVSEFGPMQNMPGEGGHICVTAYAFWETREVTGSCSIPADGGFCLVHLKPEPAWFSPGGGRSNWEHRSDQRGNVAEIYYLSRLSPNGQCVPQESKPQQGEPGRQVSGSTMKRIGTANLLRSPPGNPTFIRLRLGGAVIIQTSSKPLKTTDTATFYVFLSGTSPVEHFILRATARKGISFSRARPSDANLWDITLEPGRGSDAQTISVTCQKKSTLTSKRGLLEVLQLDFETEEQSDQLESQMVTWRLELPGNMIRDEGTMRIYTIQTDYVGIAPLITDSYDTELLNTAVLTGKRVSVPVKVLGVEVDGSITDITNSSRCRSSDQDVLKVSERCDSVYVNGKETHGKVKIMLEMSVWMPRLPLLIEMSDPELSQIKGWRVPVNGNKRVSWDTEEDDERKGRGCMLQYQHSLIRVLTVFTADSPDPSGPSPAYFLGPDWQVDVTGLVRYFLKMGDMSVARLQAGNVLAGRAAGVTTVQVMSPLSDSVLGERMIRVVDDKVSITELGVQLVSGLSLNLQISPGSNRAIVAKTTTQETMHNLKQEAVVGCWLQFSDGSRTPLDLYDPSGYFLSIISLDPRVVSVRNMPGSVFVVVAEAEGQGLLLRAELAICEACQKSKCKSKLAVGGGTVSVKFPLDEQLAGTGKKETRAGMENDRASDGEEKDSESKLILTSPSNTFQPAGIHESTPSGIKLVTTFNLQEAIKGGVSTIKSMNSMETTPITKPVADKALITVGPRSPNDYRNQMENSDFPFQVEKPKQETPLVESDLIQMFNVFADIEVCIYALVGVSCLAIIAVLLNCATHNVKSRKKSPVQCQTPSEHKHHLVPIATTCKQEMQTAVEMPRTIQMQKSTERSRGTEMIQSRDIPAAVAEERTATLGRRTNTLPLRRDPMVFRSATLLPKPVRSEPLHSPTSKRNQVQFTTFTTLDIKHLAALKKSAQSFSWAKQPVGVSQGNGIGLSGQVEATNHVNVCSQVEGSVPMVDSGECRGFLPEGPWPVAKPVSKV